MTFRIVQHRVGGLSDERCFLIEENVPNPRMGIEITYEERQGLAEIQDTAFRKATRAVQEAHEALHTQKTSRNP